MIVESNALVTVGVGAAKVQTEPGDTVMRLPNLILPALELIEPTTIFPDTNVPQSTSFLKSTFITRNNQAAGGTDIIRLAKGYWRLTISYGLRIGFAAPLAFNTNGFIVSIISPPGGPSAPLITLNPDQTGYHRAQVSFKILLREIGLLSVTYPLTGAADFLDINVQVQAERLL